MKTDSVPVTTLRAIEINQRRKIVITNETLTVVSVDNELIALKSQYDHNKKELAKTYNARATKLRRLLAVLRDEQPKPIKMESGDDE